MAHILFLIYTAVFVASWFVEGADIRIILGVTTAAALLFAFFRNICLLARGGYYQRKYLGGFLCFLVLVPYFFLPAHIASSICYAAMAGWLYIVPTLRLIILRGMCASRIKKACRYEFFQLEKAKGGYIVHTPARVYDIRLIGSFRRTAVVRLEGTTTYTVTRVLPALAEHPERMAAMLGIREGVGLFGRRLTVGRECKRTLAWSAIEDAERVLLFLPGLCEWKYNGSEQSLVNGSVVHGVTLWDADAFVDNRLH